MRFLEMAFAFAVVGFVAANSVLSLVTMALWRGVRRRELSAAKLFLIRMLPAAGSALFVVGVVLPGFLSFEPRGTAEEAGPALVVFVMIALAIIALGIARVLKGWRDTRRMEAAWTAAGTPIASPGLPVRAYRVPSEIPLAALVGVLKPRLFVSDRYFDALSLGEKQAVLAHEAAHLSAFDNLKRTVMRLAPDCLFLSADRREIEEAWARASEDEADDRAAGGDRLRCLDLAGALIKGSRMAPAHASHHSSFCNEGSIVRRVRRLLDDRPASPSGLPRLGVRLAFVFAVLLGLSLSAESGLRAAYQLTESAVQLLDYDSW